MLGGQDRSAIIHNSSGPEMAAPAGAVSQPVTGARRQWRHGSYTHGSAFHPRAGAQEMSTAMAMELKTHFLELSLEESYSESPLLI